MEKIGKIIILLVLIIALIKETEAIHPCNYFEDSVKPTQNDYAPKERTEYKAAQVKDNMYIFGGIEEGTRVASMKKLNLWNNQWEELKQEGDAPTARTGHAFIGNDTKLFVVGGNDGTNNLNDVYSYDTETSTWTKITVTGTAPAGRQGHTADIVEDALYIFGGNTTAGRTNDFYMLNLTTNVWSVKTPAAPFPAAPTARTQHNSMALGSAIFYFGGECATGLCTTEINLFNFTANSWIPGSLLPIKGTPPTARRAAAGFHYNFSLTIIGGQGESGALSADIYRFHLFNLSWTGPQTVPTKETNFKAQGEYPSVAHQEAIIITHKATEVLKFQADCYEPHQWWIWIVWGGGILLIAFILLLFCIGYVQYITYDRNKAKTAYQRLNYKEPGRPGRPADADRKAAEKDHQATQDQLIYEAEDEETPAIQLQQE